MEKYSLNCSFSSPAVVVLILLAILQEFDLQWRMLANAVERKLASYDRFVKGSIVQLCLLSFFHSYSDLSMQSLQYAVFDTYYQVWWGHHKYLNVDKSTFMSRTLRRTMDHK